MVFTTNHLIVDVWYRHVRNGIRYFEQVPNLFNSRNVFSQLLDQKVNEVEV